MIDLPSFSSDNLQKAVTDLPTAADGADILVFVVPHQFIRGMCKQLNGKVKKGAMAISLIKVNSSRPQAQLKCFYQCKCIELNSPTYRLPTNIITKMTTTKAKGTAYLSLPNKDSQLQFYSGNGEKLYPLISGLFNLGFLYSRELIDWDD